MHLKAPGSTIKKIAGALCVVKDEENKAVLKGNEPTFLRKICW